MSIVNFEEVLKSRGYRKSIHRQTLIELLQGSLSPLSAQEILIRMKEIDLTPNKTTVYRDIESLLNESIISELDFMDGKKRYEMKRDNHHHHIICTNCKVVSCIDLKSDLDSLETKVEKENSFKINSHILEFFGLCKNCKGK